QVAAQRSANSETIRENGGKIEQNEMPVQTTSGILKGEHSGAVAGHQIGQTEENLKQTRFGSDSDKHDSFKEKLEKLREAQRKAS
ncbi:hypothetical protein, partial [Rahnella aceris]